MARDGYISECDVSDCDASKFGLLNGDDVRLCLSSSCLVLMPLV